MADKNRDRRTPREKLEDLLKEIEKDMGVDKDTACNKLSALGQNEYYKRLLNNFSELYRRYIVLQRSCSN
jgi:hypothetical protein